MLGGEISPFDLDLALCPLAQILAELANREFELAVLPFEKLQLFRRRSSFAFRQNLKFPRVLVFRTRSLRSLRWATRPAEIRCDQIWGALQIRDCRHTLSRDSSETVSGLFSTRETVAVETPASLAISLIVAAIHLLLFDKGGNVLQRCR